MEEKEFKKVVSDNLLFILEKYSITQKRLAEIAGVADATVSEWIICRKVPRMDKIDKICKHFGLNRLNIISEDGMRDRKVYSSDLEVMFNYVSDHPDAAELLKTIMEISDESVKALSELASKMKKIKKVPKKEVFLSDNIRYLRKLNGMSQEDLADLFGCKSFTTIQKWESGSAEPPISVLIKLSKKFNTSIDDMIKTDLSSKYEFLDKTSK